MYDAIVVGARCAGSPTALLLARAGHRVLLVDRATFPRDTLSTLYIQQRGVAHLRRWGVRDDVAATCPALDRISYQVGDVRLDGSSRPVEGETAAYAPRRHTLDALLAAAAVRAGAEFRDGCTVEDVVRDGDRVTGVVLRTRGGRSVEYAHLVVGADGMRSTVAARVGAATLLAAPSQTCVYYGFWAGAADHFELHESAGRWIGAVPTGGGETLVQAYFPQAEFGRVRVDASAAYLHAVRTTAPDLFERMLTAGRTGRLCGTGDQRNFFRAAAGPGWALVGDAAHHRDSITANGITEAFVAAQLLVDHVRGRLDDPPGLAVALADYTRASHAAFTDDYHDTLVAARLSMPAHRVRTLREIAADPARTADFFTAMGGAPRAGAAPDLGAVARALRLRRRERVACP